MYFEKFGGNQFAAGITLKPENLQSLSSKNLML